MPTLKLPYLLDSALMVVVLLFSIIIHEVAHGYGALLNGDPTFIQSYRRYEKSLGPKNFLP